MTNSDINVVLDELLSAIDSDVEVLRQSHNHEYVSWLVNNKYVVVDTQVCYITVEGKKLLANGGFAKSLRREKVQRVFRNAFWITNVVNLIFSAVLYFGYAGRDKKSSSPQVIQLKVFVVDQDSIAKLKQPKVCN